jgi:hypothetical protein
MGMRIIFGLAFSVLFPFSFVMAQQQMQQPQFNFQAEYERLQASLKEFQRLSIIKPEDAQRMESLAKKFEDIDTENKAEVRQRQEDLVRIRTFMAKNTQALKTKKVRLAKSITARLGSLQKQIDGMAIIREINPYSISLDKEEKIVEDCKRAQAALSNIGFVYTAVSCSAPKS